MIFYGSCNTFCDLKSAITSKLFELHTSNCYTIYISMSSSKKVNYRNLQVWYFSRYAKKLLNSVKITIFREFLRKNLFLKIFSSKNKNFQKFHNIGHKKVERGTILRFLKFWAVFEYGPFQKTIFCRTTRFFNFEVP